MSAANAHFRHETRYKSMPVLISQNITRISLKLNVISIKLYVPNHYIANLRLATCTRKDGNDFPVYLISLYCLEHD